MAEQADCVTVAIERNFPEVLVLLLDRIIPLHHHLLLAIRLQATELVDALLQAGGAPLLHPKPRATRDGNTRRGPVRQRTGRSPDVDAMQQYSSNGAVSSTQAQAGAASSSRPRLTPLAEACALGDVATVEAICQWARRDRIHVDPTAPVQLGGDVPSVSLGGLGRGNDGQSNNNNNG